MITQAFEALDKRFMPSPVYLDYNGTTPLDPRVIAAMMPYLSVEFGNPSSAHWYGIKPKQALIKARSQVADLIGCRPDEIIFTSGGTESNNHAIKGTALSRRDRGNHIITSQIEHPAVLEVCRSLEKSGFQITRVLPDRHGRIDADEIERAIRPETILISIMHANNEVGTIQPVSEIARLARKKGIAMHSDAAQSIGKIPVRVNDLGVDLLSIAGHKFYAPKGIGALYIRSGVSLSRLIHGAGQEGGKRAGTENVLEIVGLGEAAAIASRDLEENARRMKSVRDLLLSCLRQRLPEIRINGNLECCLPNTLHVSFPGVEAAPLLERIGLDVAASPGAACHGDSASISHVLAAMRIPPDLARCSVRFSTGRMTTKEDILKASETIADAVMQTPNAPSAGRR